MRVVSLTIKMERFNIALPKSEVTVTVRMMTGKDETKLSEAMQNKKKKNLIGHDTNMTDQMRTYITAVNGSSQMTHIIGFVNAMPAKDSRFLRKTLSNDYAELRFETTLCVRSLWLRSGHGGSVHSGLFLA